MYNKKNLHFLSRAYKHDIYGYHLLKKKRTKRFNALVGGTLLRSYKTL